jgi:hypothetical protein
LDGSYTAKVTQLSLKRLILSVARANNFGLFAGLESGALVHPMTIERSGQLSFVLILQRPSRFFLTVDDERIVFSQS